MIKVITKTFEILINILIIIVVIAILFVGYSFIQMKNSNSEYIDIFGYTIFEIATGSMADTINIGDVVLVKMTKDINANDIIVYRQDNSFITHRVVKIEENRIITRGDANNTDDEPIDREDVLGKVINIWTTLSIWKKVLSTPQVLISIGATMILFYFTFIFKGFNKNKENQSKIVDGEK